MKAASLYILTAVVTGLYSFYVLMSVVWGAPVNLLSCSALLGSTILTVAAILMIFRSRIAARIGLGGCALLWVFYAPLIVVRCLMPFTTWIELRSLVSFREYVPLAGILVGPFLLVVCTLQCWRRSGPLSKVFEGQVDA
jgi:hypothetical protein